MRMVVRLASSTGKSWLGEDKHKLEPRKYGNLG